MLIADSGLMSLPKVSNWGYPLKTWCRVGEKKVFKALNI